MNKIEYKKILDTEWALYSAEVRAKSHWDDMLIYKDDDNPILYEIAYDKVKQLREAQKNLKEMVELLRKNDQLEYSE